MKYKNIKTVVDNIKFDSKKEALRYLELKQWLKEGRITKLVLQPQYKFELNGIKICTYRADFSYFQNGVQIINDVKGMLTPVYRLKKKLLKAFFAMDILET